MNKKPRKVSRETFRGIYYTVIYSVETQRILKIITVTQRTVIKLLWKE